MWEGLVMFPRIHHRPLGNSPISVPTPSTLPPNAIRALSPPLLPPLVSARFSGFTVRPNTLFTVSGIIIAVGTAVLQNSIAPEECSSSTRTLLWVAGSLAQ